LFSLQFPIMTRLLGVRARRGDGGGKQILWGRLYA
jgi:hypothetical protein